MAIEVPYLVTDIFVEFTLAITFFILLYGLRKVSAKYKTLKYAVTIHFVFLALQSIGYFIGDIAAILSYQFHSSSKELIQIVKSCISTHLVLVGCQSLFRIDF